MSLIAKIVLATLRFWFLICLPLLCYSTNLLLPGGRHWLGAGSASNPEQELRNLRGCPLGLLGFWRARQRTSVIIGLCWNKWLMLEPMQRIEVRPVAHPSKFLNAKST